MLDTNRLLSPCKVGCFGSQHGWFSWTDWFDISICKHWSGWSGNSWFSWKDFVGKCCVSLQCVISTFWAGLRVHPVDVSCCVHVGGGVETSLRYIIRESTAFRRTVLSRHLSRLSDKLSRQLDRLSSQPKHMDHQIETNYHLVRRHPNVLHC